MTKKDYELIAGALKDVHNRVKIGTVESSYDTLSDVIATLASELEHDNPRFDRDRFLTACGTIQD